MNTYIISIAPHNRYFSASGEKIETQFSIRFTYDVVLFLSFNPKQGNRVQNRQEVTEYERI